MLPLNASRFSPRLGKIQRNIVIFLAECGEEGGFIGSTARAAELRGYDLKQVERAVAGLVRRSIVRREGIRYILVKKCS